MFFFLSVFPFFSRDFRGSVGIKNPCFFGGFPCLFPKKTRKGRTGYIMNSKLGRCERVLRFMGRDVQGRYNFRMQAVKFGGVGWGRGGVDERGFCLGKEYHYHQTF